MIWDILLLRILKIWGPATAGWSSPILTPGGRDLASCLRNPAGRLAAGSERCEPAARAEGNFSGKAEPRQGQYEPLGMGRLLCRHGGLGAYHGQGKGLRERSLP